jgi:hypothetical protein
LDLCDQGIPAIEELRPIAVAADELEALFFLGTGKTADWPFRITTDNSADAELLVAKLQALRAALAPYRQRRQR